MKVLGFRPEVVLFLCVLGLAAGAQQAKAVEAEIVVHTPNAGQVYSAAEPIVVIYSAVPGPRGDHINVYVDEGQAMMVQYTPGKYRIARTADGPVVTAVIRDLSGQFNLGTVAPGRHLLTLEIVDRHGKRVGAMATVAFTVQ